MFKKPDFSEKSGFSEKLMFQINGELVYHPGNGQIVNKEDSTKLIPYNFIVFSVSRYEG
ncbi:MAG: hypothetical protein R2941_03495 [Desulfobacterales bacterium]